MQQLFSRRPTVSARGIGYCHDTLLPRRADAVFISSVVLRGFVLFFFFNLKFDVRQLF